jgi:hypothetical protein
MPRPNARLGFLMQPENEGSQVASSVTLSVGCLRPTEKQCWVVWDTNFKPNNVAGARGYTSNHKGLQESPREKGPARCHRPLKACSGTL